MNDKKHIDRLFQERFKDFEATPGDAVWENIEAQLNKKKKKHRIIPIWWRYAGVAALLLLLLTVGGVYFNGSADVEPVDNVVESDQTGNPEEVEEDKTSKDINKIEGVITNNNTTEDPKQQSPSDHASDKLIPSKETSIAESPSSENENQGEKATNPGLNKKSTISNQLITTKNKNTVASNSKETPENNPLLKQIKHKAIANSDIDKKKETLENEAALIEKDQVKQIINETTKSNTGIAQTNDEADNNSKTENNLRSIEDAINEDKTIIEEEKEKSNRWSIAPNAAPVYFSSLGEGSSIDPQFNNNSKSSELNMSYGIKASYAINDRLSIRSGVNRVNLGYNTNNVVMFQSVSLGSNTLSLQNVSPNVNVNSIDSPVESVSLISADNIVSGRAPEVFSTVSNASLNQSLGYIEVPLEVQYAISNNKLGVNVIGGFSSFFLNNNEIFSEAEGTRTFIGEANNINRVSYSANFGLGLNYKFSKRIDLNLEPIFKYQFNTFNNTSGDFKPYFIGVYTGFAIKF